jgi:hypothetical protein
MKKFGLILLAILSAGIGYYIAYTQSSLQKAYWAEGVIADEFALLERFKVDTPCDALKVSQKKTTIQQHQNGWIVWQYNKGHESIKKLVIDNELNIAEDSIPNTCN